MSKRLRRRALWVGLVGLALWVAFFDSHSILRRVGYARELDRLTAENEQLAAENGALWRPDRARPGRRDARARRARGVRDAPTRRARLPPGGPDDHRLDALPHRVRRRGRPRRHQPQGRARRARRRHRAPDAALHRRRARPGARARPHRRGRPPDGRRRRDRRHRHRVAGRGLARPHDGRQAAQLPGLAHLPPARRGARAAGRPGGRWADPGRERRQRGRARLGVLRRRRAVRLVRDGDAGDGRRRGDHPEQPAVPRYDGCRRRDRAHVHRLRRAVQPGRRGGRHRGVSWGSGSCRATRATSCSRATPTCTRYRATTCAT